MDNPKNKTYSLILGMRYDAEIVGKLEEVKSKAGYIKDLVRQDIAGELSNPVEFDEGMAAETIQKYRKITEEKYKEMYFNNSEVTITCACSLSKYIDIIDKMDSIENKSEYIKKLILMDMGLIDTNGNRFMLPGVEEDGLSKPRQKDDKRLEAQREYAKRTGYAAQNKYLKENAKNFSMRLFNVSDADIIKKLESVDNKAKYVKGLIRDDINKK